MHTIKILIVLCVAAALARARTITFAGYDNWIVKSGAGMGPGPNDWCDTASCVWTDSDHALHLTSNTKSTEVTLDGVYVGYGVYYMVVQGDFMSMDTNAVFGAFTYDLKSDSAPGYGEVDFEFSKWGNVKKQDIASYAIHPVTAPQKTAILPAKGINMYTLTLVWTPGKTYQRSYLGRVAIDKLDKTTPFMQLVYTGANARVPPPATTEFHFNLWQYQGRLATIKNEIRVLDFVYTTNNPVPPPPPNPVEHCRSMVMLDTNEQCRLCCVGG